MPRGKRKTNGHAEAGAEVDSEKAQDEERAEAQQRASNSRKTGKEVAQAHERLNRIEGALETARGKLRAEWKKLKEEGFNCAALKRARKDLREDPIDAQLDLEDYLTYRNLLGMDDAVDAAKQQKDRDATEASLRAAEKGSISTPETLARADQEGLDAGLAAKNRDSNPYPEGSPENLKWDAGWIGGQRQNTAKMAGSSATAPAKDAVTA